jgi:hypothetical protein
MCERGRPCSFLERCLLLVSMSLDSLGSTRLFEFTGFLAYRRGLEVTGSACFLHLEGMRRLVRSSDGTYKASLEVAGWGHGAKVEMAVEQFTLTQSELLPERVSVKLLQLSKSFDGSAVDMSGIYLALTRSVLHRSILEARSTVCYPRLLS